MAIRTLVRFARRFKDGQLTQFEDRLPLILEPLLDLLDKAPLECKYLPVEAISTFSKLNESLVAQMSPKVTPKLLQLFRNHHSEGDLGQELVNLFKKWCNFSECREIFVETFIPFIMQIVDLYYQKQPNSENQKQTLSLKDGLARLAHDKAGVSEQ